jgi:hypothetical protein
MSEYGQPQPYQPKPKKKHTVRNIVLGVFVGIFLVIGGCTALVGGALSSQNAEAPVSVTSQAGTPVDNGPDPVVTPTNAPVQPTVQPSPKVTHKPAPKLTASQEQAIGSAESYLSFTAFSRKGLIHQLSSDAGEGFSVKDATFAVDHITVDWNAQAAAKAKEYLSMQHFSRKGLIHQLESAYGEQFTHAQAVYGVTKAGL